MPQLSFQSITAKNWQACTKLELKPNQKDFIPSNLYSIAEAQFYPNANSKAIYADKELVGYVLYGQDLETKAWRLFRLMIDQSQQGKGYGRKAVQLVIQSLPKSAKNLSLSYNPANQAAAKLYKSLGFEEQSINKKGNTEAQLTLNHD